MVSDVLVAGGGPAGLATAIAARLQGMRVVVMDPCHPPIDKCCGEGLMPGGIAALARLGVRLEGGQAFRGIRFLSPEGTVAAEFPCGPGFGMRRTALHAAMVERALDVGVELRWGARVAGLPGNETFGWTVGADGQNSRVRAWAGLAGNERGGQRFGFRRHFNVRPWTDYVEVHWGDRCQVYITPAGAREVGVALISRDPHLRLDAALLGFPELAAKLSGAAPANAERGAVSATRRLRRVTKGSVALVGDASGSVYAITGDGMSLAFEQALALAEALAANRLEDYERAHAALRRRPALLGGMLLAMDAAPPLRQGALRLLRACPPLFSALLAMHVGQTRRFVIDYWRSAHEVTPLPAAVDADSPRSGL